MKSLEKGCIMNTCCSIMVRSKWEGDLPRLTQWGSEECCFYAWAHTCVLLTCMPANHRVFCIEMPVCDRYTVPSCPCCHRRESGLHRLEHLKQLQGRWNLWLLSGVMWRFCSQSKGLSWQSWQLLWLPLWFQKQWRDASVCHHLPWLFQGGWDQCWHVGMVPTPIPALPSACPTDLVQLCGCTPEQQWLQPVGSAWGERHSDCRWSAEQPQFLHPLLLAALAIHKITPK